MRPGLLLSLAAFCALSACERPNKGTTEAQARTIAAQVLALSPAEAARLRIDKDELGWLAIHIEPGASQGRALIIDPRTGRTQEGGYQTAVINEDLE